MRMCAGKTLLCKEDYMTQQTRLWLRELRLPEMERAYTRQLELPAASALGFDERFALLIQTELESRRSSRLARLLKTDNLKDKGACLEEIDFQQNRNIEKRLVANLADCRWIGKG